MAKEQLATRIDAKVKRATEKVCEARELKMDRFIEEALLDKLEEFEDIENLEQIRREPSRPLEHLLKDLKTPGC